MHSHATISKAGEVDFPLWVKVLAWAVGICIPVAILAGTWVGNVLWDMSQRMTRMETTLSISSSERYSRQEAEASHALLEQRIERNTADIEQIQDRLGMRARRRADNGQTD